MNIESKILRRNEVLDFNDKWGKTSQKCTLRKSKKMITNWPKKYFLSLPKSSKNVSKPAQNSPFYFHIWIAKDVRYITEVVWIDYRIANCTNGQYVKNTFVSLILGLDALICIIWAKNKNMNVYKIKSLLPLSKALITSLYCLAIHPISCIVWENNVGDSP